MTYTDIVQRLIPTCKNILPFIMLHLLLKIEHKFSAIKRSTENNNEVTQQRFVEKEISGTRYKNKD